MLGKTDICRRLSSSRTTRPRPSNDACRHLVDLVAAFLSEAPIFSHREGGKFIAALVEGPLSWLSLLAALSRLRFGNSQPVPVRTTGKYATHHLWVCIHDVDKYGCVAILRRRSISEAFLSITMSIRRSLSALRGDPLSTWWRIGVRLKLRDSACTRGW